MKSQAEVIWGELSLHKEEGPVRNELLSALHAYAVGLEFALECMRTDETEDEDVTGYYSPDEIRIIQRQVNERRSAPSEYPADFGKEPMYQNHGIHQAEGRAEIRPQLHDLGSAADCAVCHPPHPSPCGKPFCFACYPPRKAQ